MVDGAVLALGALRNDNISAIILRNSVRVRTDRAGARHAAERSHAALYAADFSPGKSDPWNRSGTIEPPRSTTSRSCGVIQRHDGNIFHVDVQPNIQLRPVREGKHANAFAFVEARIEDVPQFRPLILGIPLSLRIAERIDAFLGPRFLFVAARAAECRIESAGVQRIQQRLGLQQAAALLRAERERIRAVLQRFAVLMNDQLRANLVC